MAANPCPCGRLGTLSALNCFCSPEEIHRYWRKFGAALLDRIELRVALGLPEMDLGNGGEEPSGQIARRVLGAVEIQRARFKGTGIRRNARMSPGLIERHCPLSPGAGKALRETVEKLGLSGRAFHGVLRVGRTIADLEGQDSIRTVHILEAIQHRRLGDDPYDILSVKDEGV
jgi:magnesium chelatase family protein